MFLELLPLLALHIIPYVRIGSYYLSEQQHIFYKQFCMYSFEANTDCLGT